MEVAVAMSGGVDSTVAAVLLKEAGYSVVGVSMVSWKRSLCCSFEDVARARLMARRLGIKHYLIDLMNDFSEEIVKPYVDARVQGLTPNPCPACNRQFKFGKMWQALRKRTKADVLASGHYARLDQEPVHLRMRLRRAAELKRDQSYMLWQLDQDQLRRILFPLGEYTKSQVRELAREFGLTEAANKPDSQDLCFVVPDAETFWREQAPLRSAAGEIINCSGQIIGQHKGLVHYTLGQRKGLGVAAESRQYVQQILSAENRLMIGSEPVSVRRLLLRQLNWVSLAPSPEPIVCDVQVRLHGRPLAARLLAVDPQNALLELQEAIPQIAAGQSVVCYGPEGELLLGGIVG